jgi:hypothetical protein
LSRGTKELGNLSLRKDEWAAWCMPSGKTTRIGHEAGRLSALLIEAEIPDDAHPVSSHRWGKMAEGEAPCSEAVSRYGATSSVRIKESIEVSEDCSFRGESTTECFLQCDVGSNRGTNGGLERILGRH